MAQTYENIIVGAGLAGLSLGKLLGDPARTLTLEKSRGLGGRMATRRDGAATFDHGAQFYRTSTARPFRWDVAWREKGLATDWFTREGIGHRAGKGGLTALAKDLAEGQTIERSATVNRVSGGEPLLLETAEGGSYRAKRLFLTCPLPQSLQLLKASDIGFPPELSEIHYAKALVGLFHASGDTAGFDYEEKINASVFSVSNQQSKGASAELGFTVVMRPEWSEAHFEREDASILAELTAEFVAFARARLPSVQIEAGQLKRWRYSHPFTTYREPFLRLPSAPGIYLLGDAFGGPSLAGALRSAENVAAALK